VLTEFRKVYPQVTVRIQRHRDLMADLLRGHLDVGITYPRPAPRADIAVEALFSDEMLVVLPRGHPLARRAAIAVADLEGQQLIYHMDPADSALQRRYLGPAGVHLRSVTIVEQPDAIVGLVAAGLGIGVLPRGVLSAVRNDRTVTTKRIVVDGRPGLAVPWCAARRIDPDKPYVAAFVAALRAHHQTNARARSTRGPGARPTASVRPRAASSRPRRSA
jgi:DNA-binding transcriptional LysR family regulator